MPETQRPVPLQLMARRLAPLVADGCLGFTEALDELMSAVVDRATDSQLRRITELERWMTGILDRETSKCSGIPT